MKKKRTVGSVITQIFLALWLLICLEDKHLGRRWSGIRRHALISLALIFWGRWLLTMIS